MKTLARAGVGPVGVVVALLLVALAGATVAVTVFVRSVHVADDEGPGRRGERHLPTRPRAVAPADSGALDAPFVVSYASPTPTGWVLLDTSAGEVLLVGSDGLPEGRLGRRGQGPGELERPRLAARSEAGAVAVVDAFTRHLDIFPPGGDPWRRRIQGDECTVGTPVGMWAGREGEWHLVRSCQAGLSRSLEILLLPSGSPQRSGDLGPLAGPTQDLFVQPVAASLGERVYVGSTRRSCLSEVDAGSLTLADRHRCFPTPRPFATPDSLVTAVVGPSLNRAAAAGLSLALPDSFPTLAGVEATSRGPVVRVILEDLSEVWAFEEEGELVYADAPEGIAVHPGWEAWLLVRDDLEGLRIWTVPYGEWVDGA